MMRMTATPISSSIQDRPAKRRVEKILEECRDNARREITFFRSGMI